MPSHKHIFEKFPNEWFIETGTFKCEGIATAILAGFSKIRSCDIDLETYQSGLSTISGLQTMNPNVKIELFHGATEQQLANMLKDIDVPCTIWLDAHWSGEGTPKSDCNCPVLKELDVIAQHPMKNHTILVDDMRCCGTALFDFITREQIEQAVKKINPNYTLWYEHSWEPFDILVGKVL